MRKLERFPDLLVADPDREGPDVAPANLPPPSYFWSKAEARKAKAQERNPPPHLPFPHISRPGPGISVGLSFLNKEDPSFSLRAREAPAYRKFCYSHLSGLICPRSHKNRLYVTLIKAVGETHHQFSLHYEKEDHGERKNAYTVDYSHFTTNICCNQSSLLLESTETQTSLSCSP